MRLSRLRDLGFTIWDPIGLLPAGETWDHKPFASEYDSYLDAAASMLRRGEPSAAVVKFLVEIETEHMGLDYDPDSSAIRAARLVKAISEDRDIWTDEMQSWHRRFE